MALQIIIGSTDYSAYYKPGSLVITERTQSERTTFKFELENPPSVPANESSVYVWESAAQRRPKEAAGRIKRPAQSVIGPDSKLATKFAFSIEVGGWNRDLERVNLPGRTYQNVPTGFAFRDIASLIGGFDITNVTNGGANIDYFENRNSKVPQLFDRLATLNGWQWWVDPDKKLYFGDPSLQPAPFSITDSTWKTIIQSKTLRLEPDTSNLANQIRLYYNGKYQVGTVNVSVGLAQITGVGTLFTTKVKPGATFRLASTTSIKYTVQSVVSDTQLLLTSNYNEPTLTGQTYVIENIPYETQMTEQPSIIALAKITGDNGVYFDNVSGPSSYLTFEEARQFLLGILKQRAYPNMNISFKSTSRQITGTVHAGMMVPFALTEWGLNISLQIKELTKKDIGQVDSNGYPIYEYDFKFETRLYNFGNLFRIQQIVTTESGSTQTQQDDITGAYLDTPTFLENYSDISPLQLATDAPKPTEVTILDNSPQAPPFYWGQVGRITTNANGSLTDSVTGRPVIRWGWFEWA